MPPPASRPGGRRPAYCPLPTTDPTMAWPARLGPPGLAKLAILLQLEESQWWSPAELLTQQLRQAAALLDHARREVPFYRDRLARAGIAAERPLTPETWARMPLLSRAELQAAGEALHAGALPPGHGLLYELATSGATGRPLKARGSGAFQHVWDALTLREHLWHQRDFGAKLAAIRSFPNGTAEYPAGIRSAFWNSTVSQIFGDGPAVGLHIGASAAEQAEWLQREQPAYLLTYPSALRDLLIHCRAHGIRIAGLRQVRTLSELLSPDLRDLCREVWGLEIVDLYSAQETGYLAMQCPEEGSYHVPSEAVLLEVLDAAGRPCGVGEVGEVVVTPLHNFAMPLLRYAVGDLAEVGAPCPCGRGLPVLNRILGRTRDMLVFPDGRRAWAQLGTSQFTRIACLRQFQIVQHAVDDLEIKLVAERELTAEEEAELRSTMQARCGHPFPIRITYHASIPRSAGGKFQDFICRIPEAGATAR